LTSAHVTSLPQHPYESSHDAPISQSRSRSCLRRTSTRSNGLVSCRRLPSKPAKTPLAAFTRGRHRHSQRYPFRSLSYFHELKTQPPKTDFFFTKSRYPTTAQKDELVAQIRAQFEGFEAYDRDCLGRWFAGQRVVHGNGKAKVEPGEGKGKGPGKKSHHKIKSDMIRTFQHSHPPLRS
jgi:hypothetical protein